MSLRLASLSPRSFFRRDSYSLADSKASTSLAWASLALLSSRSLSFARNTSSMVMSSPLSEKRTSSASARRSMRITGSGASFPHCLRATPFSHSSRRMASSCSELKPCGLILGCPFLGGKNTLIPSCWRVVFAGVVSSIRRAAVSSIGEHTRALGKMILFNSSGSTAYWPRSFFPTYTMGYSRSGSLTRDQNIMGELSYCFPPTPSTTFSSGLPDMLQCSSV